MPGNMVVWIGGVLLCLLSCGSASGQVAPSLFISGLNEPTYIANAPADTAVRRLFILEKGGAIKVAFNGVVQPRLFLDLRGSVDQEGERGLLGIAFHPNYARNRLFYVYYNAIGGADTLWEFKTTRNRNRADPQSARLLLSVPKQFTNHNGGQLAFGRDRMLYVGLGDGGGSGDPSGNAQNLNSLLGKILRISVTRRRGYGIPAGNPFRGVPNARGEIWAYGLRNPWRFSFDRLTRTLFCGDVGQNRIEEVNIIQKGGNYGWNILEGSACFSPPESCSSAGTVLPVSEYGRDEGQSIIGGYVYRGGAIPALQGKYVFGDFVSGNVWSLQLNSATGAWERTLLFGTASQITSFGEDNRGELYLVDLRGNIYKLAPG